MRSCMKYNTVIYGFYRAKKGIDFGKSLFVLEGIICSSPLRWLVVLGSNVLQTSHHASVTKLIPNGLETAFFVCFQ